MSCCGGSQTRNGKVDRTKPVRKFKYGGPAVKGDAYALFDDGRCYRVEGPRKTWYIYNDTLEYEMHVSFTFSPENGAKRPRHAATTTNKVGSKWVQCNLIVYPLQTAKYVKFGTKEVQGYRASNIARPLTAGYIERVNREARAKESEEERKVAKVAGTAHSDEELMYKCRKSKIMYVDMKFKPSRESLKRPQDKKAVSNMDNITWQRPQDIIPEEARGKVALFTDRIDPSDIGQGQLGDCWLMCSISVVANSSTMVKDMFRHPVSKSKQKKEQKVGAYRVYINKCGWWRNVIVDSYLPTYNGSLYFGRNATDPYEMWVSLLEKAYAKVHGSYASIIGGDALNALQDLTGFPVYAFNDVWRAAATSEEKASAFFKDLLRYRKAGYLISVSTPGSDNSSYNVGAARNEEAFEERYRKAGLGTGHAYSVMSVRQFTFPKVKLLKIRNPWGTGTEWTGAWGKNSDKWKKHSLARRSCKPSMESDGTFWMEWGDVVKYFDGGGVCMLKKHWYDYRIRGRFVGIEPSVVLKIELKKKQKILFSLSQKDRRELDPNDPEQLYKGFLIAVSCVNHETGMQEVCAISTANPEEHPAETFSFVVKRDIGLEMELNPEKGPYYVIPRIMTANKSGPKDFTLGVLTPERSTEKGLRVSFLTLPADCPVLKNVKRFEPPTPDRLLNTQFQRKKRGGVPERWEGITIFGANMIKEDYPFPY